MIYGLVDVDEMMNQHLGPKTGEYDMAGAIRRKPKLWEKIYHWWYGVWKNDGISLSR